MRLPHRMIYLTLVFLALPVPAWADTVTLVSSRDASIYQGNTSNGNGAGQAMFAGKNGQGNPARALIGFDIAGSLPAGSTVTGAQLTLVLDRSGSSESKARQLELHRL